VRFLSLQRLSVVPRLSRATTPWDDPASVFRLLTMPPESVICGKLHPYGFSLRVFRFVRNGDHSIAAVDCAIHTGPFRSCAAVSLLPGVPLSEANPVQPGSVPHSARTGNAHGIWGALRSIPRPRVTAFMVMVLRTTDRSTVAPHMPLFKHFAR